MQHLGIREESLRVTGADTPGPRLEGDDSAASVSAAHQASPSPGVSGLRLASSARQDVILSHAACALPPNTPSPKTAQIIHSPAPASADGSGQLVMSVWWLPEEDSGSQVPGLPPGQDKPQRRRGHCLLPDLSPALTLASLSSRIASTSFVVDRESVNQTLPIFIFLSRHLMF